MLSPVLPHGPGRVAVGAQRLGLRNTGQLSSGAGGSTGDRACLAITC